MRNQYGFLDWELSLTDELPADKINYGHLQVTFEDGSVGWYEAGWGPMMSETAFFVKDVVGPKGSASIVAADASARGKSSSVDAHTQTERILVHRSQTNEKWGTRNRPTNT